MAGRAFEDASGGKRDAWSSLIRVWLDICAANRLLRRLSVPCAKLSSRDSKILLRRTRTLLCRALSGGRLVGPMKLCAEIGSFWSSGRRGPMNVSCCRAVMLQLVGEIGIRLPIDADPLCVEKCLDAPRWAPIVRVEMVRFGKTSNEGMWVETFVLKVSGIGNYNEIGQKTISFKIRQSSAKEMQLGNYDMLNAKLSLSSSLSLLSRQ
ncbi:unnamed protein product [Microthlaspi erraticum]|uniref:Uncharacterized protein n=1 Tax=Microthlaspi erraticum TaxID=1685480 RepID=A0A6D2HU80_9BRAS|nr:unnamed protein product [Microthlaspi erraticum]